MLTGLCDHVDDLLRAVRGDEDAFNRFAEAERLGVYLAAWAHLPLCDRADPHEPPGKRVAFGRCRSMPYSYRRELAVSPVLELAVQFKTSGP